MPSRRKTTVAAVAGVLIISSALAPKTNASPPPSEMTQPASTQLIDAMKNGFPYVVDTTNRNITIDKAKLVLG